MSQPLSMPQDPSDPTLTNKSPESGSQESQAPKHNWRYGATASGRRRWRPTLDHSAEAHIERNQIKLAKLYNSKVKEAREAYRAKASQMLALYAKNIKAAMKAGNHEVVASSIEWFFEHMPAEDGVRVLDPSVDKAPSGPTGPSGPTIQIGFALGGLGAPAALPSAPAPAQAFLPPSTEVIDVSTTPITTTISDLLDRAALRDDPDPEPESD